ncbi:hypothetical protein V2H45_15685 [Tumidithrix elongata RA019]|uniref:DUF2306 domain-containing protein n=1 Tax=Tumidithrix elongata BACA0141 TaxID=2716417 RepID=A0AAW9PV49_9CYAN|nr:hypothetical protein [Tumidithrix elongata RA019]
MNGKFQTRWITATTIGFNVGCFFGLYFFFTLPVTNGERSDSLPHLLFSSALGSALGGLFLGISQWLVLRKHIPNANRWIAATAGSITLSCTMYVVLKGLLDPSIYVLVGLTLLGIASVGIAQGWVLGKSKIWRWLRTTLIGLISFSVMQCISFALGLAIFQAFFGHLDKSWALFGYVIVGAPIAGGIAGAATYGAITGRALIGLLKGE